LTLLQNQTPFAIFFWKNIRKANQFWKVFQQQIKGKKFEVAASAVPSPRSPNTGISAGWRMPVFAHLTTFRNWWLRTARGAQSSVVFGFLITTKHL
jgi:hypothetical protein